MADDRRAHTTPTPWAGPSFPNETYFFLADFSPWDAGRLARASASEGILTNSIRELAEEGPGRGASPWRTALEADGIQVDGGRYAGVF